MDNLCFCSAAFGSWGIVRLGSLVPECKMLFVCPYSCGRHNSIGAIKHGYKDRISYLFIDEKDIEGQNLSYRSIQLGIRNNAIKKYVNDWIVQIEDITQYVKELNSLRRKGIDITSLLPNEKVYSLL